MKVISSFFMCALALITADAFSAPVATTAGSNLTAYNPTSGSINNSNWNSYMNPRSQTAADAPTANFGNCNSIILRCAQPKCSGCTTMDVARPIVAGCVESNASCKEYGDDLIDYIAAQLVASAVNKANQQLVNAQMASAQESAQQSNLQLQQMQYQMQQLQAQMQQQNAETTAQLQAALEEQKQLTAQAIAQANSAQQAQQVQQTQTVSTTTSNNSALTPAQTVAVQSGVSADVIAREQISGQILSKIENAEVALKEVKAAMNTAFEYAGCDTTGNNCTGPKRVKTFKQKAMEFFDPYNNVLDELYDALILAQSVGVDITDIYMMLNGTCNVWGQYLCGPGQVMHYDNENCGSDGISKSITTNNGTTRGGAQCEVGRVVPMSDGGCQPIKTLSDQDEVMKNWLNYDSDAEGAQIRVGCMSEILDNSPLFGNIKKQSSIDIEVLQRIIEQDAITINSLFSTDSSKPSDSMKYCAVNEDLYADLQKAVMLKKLPDRVCVEDEELKRTSMTVLSSDTTQSVVAVNITEQCRKNYSEYSSVQECICRKANSGLEDPWFVTWQENKCVCLYGDEEKGTFNYETTKCEEKVN